MIRYDILFIHGQLIIIQTCPPELHVADHWEPII